MLLRRHRPGVHGRARVRGRLLLRELEDEVCREIEKKTAELERLRGRAEALRPEGVETPLMDPFSGSRW